MTHGPLRFSKKALEMGQTIEVEYIKGNLSGNLLTVSLLSNQLSFDPFRFAGMGRLSCKGEYSHT